MSEELYDELLSLRVRVGVLQSLSDQYKSMYLESERQTEGLQMAVKDLTKRNLDFQIELDATRLDALMLRNELRLHRTGGESSRKRFDSLVAVAAEETA